ECLRDVLDLPGLQELLGQLWRRSISLVEVETPTASPFASSLLFDYVATYMYEGDAPNAERRAAALSLDRDLLRELLGQAALRELERAGTVVRGELRPGGTEREWCDPEVLRRLRRASLAVLRREIEPADQRALARFAASWQGIDRHPAQGAGVDRLREVLVPLQGIALPVEAWERDVLPRRVGTYSPTWMDQLCASGELVWIGAGAIGRRSGRVALYFREDAPHVGPPPSKSDPPAEPEHDAVR